MRDAFEGVHPAVGFGFFSAVILLTAFVLHPALTGISLAAACAYYIMLKGKRAVSFCLFGVLPLILLLAVLNPMFNHAGVTVLFWLWNGNAVTLEAVLYGVVSACMFAALVIWCACLNAVTSGDKYVYLFGRFAPVLSLLFSMVLRFVPRFVKRIRLVYEAQTGLEKTGKKSLADKVKTGLAVISATVTWALEGAVTSADSMKSRGYGLKGRTMFSNYRFTKRDAWVSAILLFSFGLSVYACSIKSVWFRFYPSIRISEFGVMTALGLASFAILTLLPIFVNIKERYAWRTALSKV